MDAGPSPAASTSAPSRRTNPLGPRAKRACDQCKFRKIKCSLSHPCAACLSMGFECTFFKPQKKRGPVGHRVSEIRRQQGQVLSTHRAPEEGSAAGSPASQPAQSSEADSPSSIALPGFELPSQRPPSATVDGSQVNPSPSQPAPGAASAALDRRGDSPVGWGDPQDVEYWLPNSLDSPLPVFDFPGSDLHVKPALPPILPAGLGAPRLDVSTEQPLSNTSYFPVSQPTRDAEGDMWPSYISEASLIPWIDVYFDRLHPTLPVLNRSSLFTRIFSREHRRNPQFGSLLLSLCAFSLTQPVEITERPTSSSRAHQARSMMNEATKMRSCSDFGENPTLDAVLTSFFLFACLFGSNQHNAAWLRLREAVDLAATMGLNDPDSYQNLSSEENGQRLRTYFVLSVTERAYALQRRHPIGFRGRPAFSMRPIHEFIHNATHRLVSDIIVHNEKDAVGMMGLALLMELFDAIDEDIIECWNGRCSARDGRCQGLDENKALTVHRNLVRVNRYERYRSGNWSAPGDPSSSGDGHSGLPRIMLQDTQYADIFITQRWLQNRIWHLCSSHGLLKAHPDHPELAPHYAIAVAESTLDLCRSLHLSAMEVHGIGLVEKLYDIATSAINIASNGASFSNAPDGNPTEAPAAGDMFFSAPLPPQTSPAPAPGTASIQPIAQGFLKLLTALRGGNHPYLERYKAHLHSIHVMGNEYPGVLGLQ